MAADSSIEWTDATWNPSTGCTKISPGCANCYIETTVPFRVAGRKFVGGKIPLILHEDRLDKPLHWTKPKRIFVNSLSDLFHEDVPDSFIDRVFTVMALTRQHTYQVLTKRPERMAAYMARLGKSVKPLESIAREMGHTFVWEAFRNPSGRDIALLPWPIPNVWLGVTAENQEMADERIPHLLQCSAAVRFLSCEPLLGPVDLSAWLLLGIGWVIAGGESGPRARPMSLEWARNLRDQCKAAKVPFFFKQWGEWISGKIKNDRSFAGGACVPTSCGTAAIEICHAFGDTGVAAHRVGKKTAGRELDGREWNQFPKVPA